MTGAQRVRGLELALALLAGSAVLIALIVALDVLRFALPALLEGPTRPSGTTRSRSRSSRPPTRSSCGGSVRRCGARRARSGALRHLPAVGRREIAGRAVTVVADARPLAFCGGLLRPGLYVSDAALARLGERELRAVIEHEAHHARRRDPLRLVAAQTAADAFGFLPPLRGLARAEAALADLAADAAAVAAVGSRAPLASAWLALEEPAPERVDHLLGRLPAGRRARRPGGRRARRRRARRRWRSATSCCPVTRACRPGCCRRSPGRRCSRAGRRTGPSPSGDAQVLPDRRAVDRDRHAVEPAAATAAGRAGSGCCAPAAGAGARACSARAPCARAGARQRPARGRPRR